MCEQQISENIAKSDKTKVNQQVKKQNWLTNKRKRRRSIGKCHGTKICSLTRMQAILTYSGFINFAAIDFLKLALQAENDGETRMIPF